MQALAVDRIRFEPQRERLDRLRRPGDDDLLVTFAGLVERTEFIPQMKAMLAILEDALAHKWNQFSQAFDTGYRGARRAGGPGREMVECKGFTREACWSEGSWKKEAQS